MSALEQAWYDRSGWLVLLWPLSMLFRLLTGLRRRYLVAKVIGQSPVPVVVVGNITVGGTGKTPVIIGLGQTLQQRGFKPGVISRGYLGKAPEYPFVVHSEARVEETGDEALLIARTLGCPVVVDPDRPRALAKICQDFDCDVILSDDGLQHYALARDIEIVVVDGVRLFGNGMCLPAGPLREPVSRLNSVPFLVLNGASDEQELPAELRRAQPLQLQPDCLVNLSSGDRRPFNAAPFNIGTTLNAVTGIGNPQRFFKLLSTLPYRIEQHVFPDHHPFSREDFDKLAIDPHQPIVLTEKDAVKCREFAADNFWVLHVKVTLPDALVEPLVSTLRQRIAERATG